MSKEIVKKEDKTSNVISETVQALAEGVTGLASSSRKDLIISVGTIFQRLRSGAFLSILLEEWNHYRGKGKIKDDYINTEQHKACLGELFGFLEKDIPDEVRFSILKQIFLVAAEEELSSRDDVMPLQYMQIARSLSNGEILILNACFTAAEQDFWKENGDNYGWHDYIAKETGIAFKDLIDIHVKTLEHKTLLFPPKYSDRSGLRIKPYFRLTELGYHFCKFINAYERKT